MKLNVWLGCLLLICFTDYKIFQPDVHICHVNHNTILKIISIGSIDKVVRSTEPSHHVNGTFYFCKVYESTKENSIRLPSEGMGKATT